MSSSQVQSLLKSFNKWRGLTEAQLADWVGSLHTTVFMSTCFALMLSLPGNRLLNGWEAYCNDTASRTWCLQAGRPTGGSSPFLRAGARSLSRLWLCLSVLSPRTLAAYFKGRLLYDNTMFNGAFTVKFTTLGCMQSTQCPVNQPVQCSSKCNWVQVKCPMRQSVQTYLW